MNVFVFNCGSSSVKAQVVDPQAGVSVLGGRVERIGETGARLATWQRLPSGTRDESSGAVSAAGHRAALAALVEALAKRSETFANGLFSAIGHRVVHGGERYRQPAVIDDAVLEAIRSAASLASLHNAANLAGIDLARERWPAVPQVAVFDTAFHQTLPPHAFHYALPMDLCQSFGIRRYGFHGTSHRCVARRAAALLGRPLESLRLITLHLGNGASAAAIDLGRSVDTSMGFTPLEGLMMSTRCGDVDPGIVFHLSRATGKSLDELETLLKSGSGLKGVCGASDMRDVVQMAEAGDARAELALTMFCYRIKKFVGAYFAVLGRVDALVFTAGIGENSAVVRRRVCAGLEQLGIALDDTCNESAAGECEVQRADGAVKVLVIPTNEELEIAEQTVACLQSARSAAAD
jgi:acetate kinase